MSIVMMGCVMNDISVALLWAFNSFWMTIGGLHMVLLTVTKTSPL